jgi:hypothetical protein
MLFCFNIVPDAGRGYVRKRFRRQKVAAYTFWEVRSGVKHIATWGKRIMALTGSHGDNAQVRMPKRLLGPCSNTLALQNRSQTNKFSRTCSWKKTTPAKTTT